MLFCDEVTQKYYRFNLLLNIVDCNINYLDCYAFNMLLIVMQQGTIDFQLCLLM